MEDALMGNSIIRQYFKAFSPQHWNKVARLTFTIAIQQLMKQDTRCLTSDFSRLSLESLEEIVGKYSSISFYLNFKFRGKPTSYQQGFARLQKRRR